MPLIEVEAGSGGEYIVTVQEGGGATVHRVKVDPEYARKLTGGRASTEELLLLSFEFLLEREPKESILRSFDLPSDRLLLPRVRTHRHGASFPVGLRGRLI